MQARLVILSTLLCVFLLQTVTALCPYECDCSDEPSHCSPGISLVQDGCNCCKVCAKQAGEQCDGHGAVCDEHRGLFCDFSRESSGDWGVCAARSGRPCFDGDIRILSGSMVEPSCKKKCWCLDGSLGCMPLCPHEIHTPRADLCPNARLQTVPGECCDQWVCDTPSGDIRVLPLDNFWDEYVSEDGGRSLPVQAHLSGNRAEDVEDIDADWSEDADGDFEYQFTRNQDRNQDQEKDYHWLNNIIPGDRDAAIRHMHETQRRRARCNTKASAWSHCSKSCGLGLSTRVTNDNPQCTLVRESRLCELRTCEENLYKPKRSKQCSKAVRRSRRKVTITYAGCNSVRKIKPKYCGECRDKSRCCTPTATRNLRLRFRCDDGRYFTKTMMIIKNCECSRNCADSSARTSPNHIRLSLYGDMLRNTEER